MMPQPMEHRLVCLLLPWITILSICQLAFTTFFFTAVYPGLFQNINDVSPKATLIGTVNNMQSGKMMTFSATPGKTPGSPSDTIEWTADKEDPELLSSQNEKLIIQQDGYYFLFLQVKLNLSEEQQNKGGNYIIRLLKKETVLLEVMVNTTLSMSTGAMGKMVFARATEFLKVTIEPPARAESNSFFTHLGVLYLPEQKK